MVAQQPRVAGRLEALARERARLRLEALVGGRVVGPEVDLLSLLYLFCLMVVEGVVAGVLVQQMR